MGISQEKVPGHVNLCLSQDVDEVWLGGCDNQSWSVFLLAIDINSMTCTWRELLNGVCSRLSLSGFDLGGFKTLSSVIVLIPAHPQQNVLQAPISAVAFTPLGSRREIWKRIQPQTHRHLIPWAHSSTTCFNPQSTLTTPSTEQSPNSIFLHYRPLFCSSKMSGQGTKLLVYAH